MERGAIGWLSKWKENPNRKPLILKGARQVGKTWLMRDFGKRFFENTVYLNFDEEPELRPVFEANKNPQRIMELLSMVSGEKIVPGKTLVLFDEVQECPEALNSLKYFNEKLNSVHMIAAGSLLGTLLAAPKSFPVGNVDILELGPLTFAEFLLATDEPLYRYYETISPNQKIEEIFHGRLLERYHTYLIVGGMPESVSSWMADKDPERVLQIQRSLIDVYEHDFSKHNGKVSSGRILMVFRSIVSQLSNKKRKFVYGTVKEGARAREFSDAIEWLVSAGMINRVYNVSKPEHPLPAFDKLDFFKLYLFDTGLLKCMAGIDNRAILLKTAFQLKGPLTENFVLQQLKPVCPVQPRYYATRNSEIDFLVQNGKDVIPVEVKGGEDKSAPAFKKFLADRNPPAAVRFSERGYLKNGMITNIPLYLAGELPRLL